MKTILVAVFLVVVSGNTYYAFLAMTGPSSMRLALLEIVEEEAEQLARYDERVQQEATLVGPLEASVAAFKSLEQGEISVGLVSGSRRRGAVAEALSQTSRSYQRAKDLVSNSVERKKNLVMEANDVLSSMRARIGETEFSTSHNEAVDELARSVSSDILRLEAMFRQLREPVTDLAIEEIKNSGAAIAAIPTRGRTPEATESRKASVAALQKLVDSQRSGVLSQARKVDRHKLKLTRIVAPSVEEAALAQLQISHLVLAMSIDVVIPSVFCGVIIFLSPRRREHRERPQARTTVPAQATPPRPKQSRGYENLIAVLEKRREASRASN